MKIELTRGWDGETIKAGEVANAHDALVWLRENSPSKNWADMYWASFIDMKRCEVMDFGSHEYFGRLWE